MRQFCPLGCSPCLIHHWMFYSIEPWRLCGRCPDCGGAWPAVGAHITFSKLPVCCCRGRATELESKMNSEDACSLMIKHTVQFFLLRTQHNVQPHLCAAWAMELNAKQPQQATSTKFNHPNFLFKLYTDTSSDRDHQQDTWQICKQLF